MGYLSVQRQANSASLSRLTTRAHVDEGVVDQNQFVEVKLIGEPLALGLMKDPLVVVISRKQYKKDIYENNSQRNGVVLLTSATVGFFCACVPITAFHLKRGPHVKSSFLSASCRL